MGIYIYKEDKNTGLVVVYSATKPAATRNITKVNGVDIPTERQKYNLLDTVTDINTAFNFANKDYKTIRDALKTKVDEVGFENLIAAEQVIAATHNIGTGAEILAAVPDNAVRDAGSAEYLRKLKTKVRPQRAIDIESKTWSRCKHILVGGVEMPSVIYSQITIANPQAGEICGNLLENYSKAGIVGIAGGDSILGILDYIQETAGTRFFGAGLLSTAWGAVPAGYNTIQEFATDLANIILLGELDTIV